MLAIQQGFKGQFRNMPVPVFLVFSISIDEGGRLSRCQVGLDVVNRKKLTG
jgi:hypothetical protein